MDQRTPAADERQHLPEDPAAVKELAQDLIELDQAIAASTEHIENLTRSGSAAPAAVSAEAFVKLKDSLIEFREKIIVLHSEIERQRELVRDVQSSLSWKLSALARGAAKGIMRSASRVVGPSGTRMIRQLMHVRPGTSSPSAESRTAADAPQRAQRGASREEPFPAPLPVSECGMAHPYPDNTIVAQALRQMRTPRGIDAFEGYVHRAVDFVDAKKLDIKAIAFYIPRFYRISQDRSERNGVNPWTDICEAMPQYLGHYQPRFPGELGFYDQRLPDVMRRQVELARQYGIFGFCFDYYWYGGRQQRSRPLNAFLSDAGLNFQFCVCWINWSSPQPEDESESQALPTEPGRPEEVAFIASLEPLFSDPRYIRIDGKPVLIVRAPGALPNVRRAVKRWRSQVKKTGFPDVYLVGWVGNKEPADFDFDAALEFPPHDFTVSEITSESVRIDPAFAGHVYSYRHYVEKHGLQGQQPFVNFKAVMTSWDDEPLRPGAGESFAGATPALYARWLDRCCRLTMSHRPEERLLFIHAWNNWSEGAYLEPDRKFGYAYLQASANTLRRYQDVTATASLIERLNTSFVPRSQVAVIFHCHYEDLIAPVFERYLAALKGADLFVTVHPDVSSTAVERMHELSSNIYFLCEENRGRDIRPFLLALRHIRRLGYATACKIHTKKTPQVETGFGESWRERLIESLLGSEKSLTNAVEIFSAHHDVGILAPNQSVLGLSLPIYHGPNRFWLDRLLQRMDRSDLIGNYAIGFPAGSMYWFRVEALAGLDDLILAEDAFEDELGQRDGTLAHAVERLVGLYAQQRGFCTKEVSEYSL